MGISLGDEMPNFEADTTVGRIKFHDWLGGSYVFFLLDTPSRTAD